VTRQPSNCTLDHHATKVARDDEDTKMERWPSGLRRPPGKRVHGNVSGVRIPFSPPFHKKTNIYIYFFME
jgi:hypothetical protein